MNGSGAGIGNILAEFRRLIIAAETSLSMPYTSEQRLRDLDTCMWNIPGYPEVLKALSKHPEFKYHKKAAKLTADMYICGFYRGLRDVLWINELKRRRSARYYRRKLKHHRKPAYKPKVE